MVCRLFGAKSISEPMLTYYIQAHQNKFQWNLDQTTAIFIQEKQFEIAVDKTLGLNNVVSASTYLSGNACNTVGISTPEMALYRIQSHTPTRSTTGRVSSMGTMWEGMPCQKWSRKDWTSSKLALMTVSRIRWQWVRYIIKKVATCKDILMAWHGKRFPH